MPLVVSPPSRLLSHWNSSPQLNRPHRVESAPVRPAGIRMLTLLLQPVQLVAVAGGVEVGDRAADDESVCAATDAPHPRVSRGAFDFAAGTAEASFHFPRSSWATRHHGRHAAVTASRGSSSVAHRSDAAAAVERAQLSSAVCRPWRWQCSAVQCSGRW